MIHSQRELEDMVEEIEQRGDGLSDWETQFIDDMGRMTGNYSFKQAEIIDRIYTERVK